MATQEVSHITTDMTLTADLKASLLKGDLEDRGICEMRAAERMARLCVSLTEAGTYDAALWKGAEALYRFMDGRHEAVGLINRDASVRALYLTMAVQCMAVVRLALEGGFSKGSMATAYAGIQQHREQLAARRAPLTVVEGGKL